MIKCTSMHTNIICGHVNCNFKNEIHGIYRICFAAMPSGQGPRGNYLTLYQRISFTQLKINTASDPDTRLHLPSYSSQQTPRLIQNLFLTAHSTQNK